MNRIKVILWDIDGTLLNFHMAEKAAIRALFARFGLGICTDEMLQRYSVINAGYWKKLEKGEMSKPQILTARFETFFREYGLDTGRVADFNAAYQLALGDTVCFYPGGLEAVKALKGIVKQYAVTNGTLVAQQKKLAASGLDKLLDGVFISDVIGIEKPNIGFFHAVWESIGAYDPNEVLIVGDSLTSDIKGGNNAGIKTCWFNPNRAPAPEDLRIDYDIAQLWEVPGICGCKMP